MMAELAIIFSFVILAIIISFAFGSSIHKRQIAYNERRETLKRESLSGQSSEKIEQLEDRVRVLERLATDRGQDLASQIEDLRSLPDADLSRSKAEKV